MKQYSIFHVPFMSFYSKSLYRDVCQNWKGVLFGYLLLLVVVCWIPRLVKIHTGFTRFVENDVPTLVSQVPTITIADGQASIDEPQPYTIEAPDSGEIICVIDTTGTITSLNEVEAYVLLTKTQLMFKKSEYETRTLELSEMEDMIINQDWINHWINIIKPWVTPIIAIFAAPFSYVFRIVQALIYGAIGLLFAQGCHSTRSYASLVRMSVLAVTPVMIVSTLLTLAGIHIPFAGMIGFAAAMGYLYFGVTACADLENPQSGGAYPTEVLSAVPNMTAGPLIVDDNEQVNFEPSADIPRYKNEPGQ